MLKKYFPKVIIAGIFLGCTFLLQAQGQQIPPSPSATPAYQPFLQEIANAPSPQRIEQDIRKLVSFGTRHTLSDTVSATRGIGAARRWIKKEFEKISKECGNCLEVVYVRHMVTGENRIPRPVEVVSVVAIQRGTSDPKRVVMI